MVSNEENDSQFWIPISDLMSGLMVIFIFIAIAFISQNSSCDCGGKSCKDVVDSLKNITVGLDSTNEYLVSYDSVNKITANYKSTRKQIIAAANGIKVSSCNMEFDTNKLAFIFKNKNFNKGTNWMPTKEFRSCLEKLLPEVSKLIISNIKEIEEIRIEGYCSKEKGNKRYDEFDNTFRRGREVFKIWIPSDGKIKGLTHSESKKILQKIKIVAKGATNNISFNSEKNYIEPCNDDSCRRVEIVIKPKFEEVFINSIQK